MAQEKKEKKQKKIKDTGMPFGKRNFQLLVIGILILVVGYILMAQPPVDNFLSLTLAPIVLLVAYLIIIPYSILYDDKKKSE